MVRVGAIPPWLPPQEMWLIYGMVLVGAIPPWLPPPWAIEPRSPLKWLQEFEFFCAVPGLGLLWCHHGSSYAPIHH
jgi:hypothetical protein